MFVIDAVDTNAEESGVWTDYQGSEFLIASTASMPYMKHLSKLYYPHRKQIEKGKIDPELAINMVCKATAKRILLGWKGVGDSEGNDIPYSFEAAYSVLRRDEEFREFVTEFAGDMANFKAEYTEEAVKM